MKVLVVGGGARENAIVDALLFGKAEVYAFMPHLNPGIKRSVKGFEIGNLDDATAAANYAKKNQITLAMIGPEAPLAAGFADEFEKNGIKCVGPKKKLARIETSKGFARKLLQKYRIDASPKFAVFDRNSSILEIKKALDGLEGFVVKPDGLTGGKGVKVSGEHLNSREEALSYCNEILEKHAAVVIEEKLEGEEFSLQTLTDGEGFLHFPIVQDHKRAFEGDNGNNTGGMGSYSDSNLLLPFLTAEDVEKARKITEKVAAALKKETGEPYKGVLYGGFMKTASGIKLIEYNARFGDPEAMNVLPLLKTNFAEVCKAAADGRLGEVNAEFEKKATVCKYIVPKGYPDNPETGRITVPMDTKALVYYASVEGKEDGIYTAKSRAVAFVGIGNTIEEAEKIAEDAASKVEGRVYHRRDIGTKELVKKRVEHMKKLMGK